MTENEAIRLASSAGEWLKDQLHDRDFIEWLGLDFDEFEHLEEALMIIATKLNRET